MKRINFSDNIPGKGRQLHFQTHFAEASAHCVHTLFDGGRVLAVFNQSVNKDLGEKAVENLCREAHHSRVNELELLFQVSVRIKTVRHAPSLRALGRSFLRWGLLDEAISELELAKAIEEKSLEGVCDLAEAYRRRGGLKEASDLLESLMQSMPESQELLQMSGEVAAAGGRWSDAQKFYGLAADKGPKNLSLYLKSARCYIDQALSVEEAAVQKKALTGARTQIGKVGHHFKLQHGRIDTVLRQVTNGQLEKAIETVDQWIQDDPEAQMDARHDYFYLNYLYGERGRDSAAIDDYVANLEKLLIEKPDNARLHNRVGIAYLLQCRHLIVKSIFHFQKALKLDSGFKRARRNLQLVKNDSRGFLILLRALLK